MPVVVYRQPWFWAVIAAVAALLVLAVVLAASSGRQPERETTIVQPPPAPAPAPPEPQVVPVPTPAPAPAPSPAPRPQPPVVRERERTITIRPEEERPSPGRPEESAPSHGATGSEGAALFRDTGLPRELRFDTHRYEATATLQVRDPERQLTPVGAAEDGTELYAPPNATEPYPLLLAPVPDRPNTFVRYERR